MAYRGPARAIQMDLASDVRRGNHLGLTAFERIELVVAQRFGECRLSDGVSAGRAAALDASLVPRSDRSQLGEARLRPLPRVFARAATCRGSETRFVCSQCLAIFPAIPPSTLQPGHGSLRSRGGLCRRRRGRRVEDGRTLSRRLRNRLPSGRSPRLPLRWRATMHRCFAGSCKAGFLRVQMVIGRTAASRSRRGQDADAQPVEHARRSRVGIRR